MRKHLQVGEAEMRFYERVCCIRKWKDHIPTAGPFDKRRLKEKISALDNQKMRAINLAILVSLGFN